MLSLLLSVLLPAAAPTPLPTLPPEITHTVTTAECNTLQGLTLPIGVVTRANDRAFGAMAVSMQKFLSHFMPGDVPSAADVQAALGNPNVPTLQQNTSPVNPTSNSGGTPLTAELGGEQGDDSLVYGPGQILNAARIDAVAQQIYENLTLERKYLKESYKRYPDGANARVDALREQAKGMIALQQSLADRYEQFASTFIGNIGVAEMIRQDQSTDATFKIALRGLLLGDTAELQGTDGTASANDPYFGYGNVDDLAKDGSNGQVVQAMRRQQFTFTSALVNSYNTCHGTNFVLRPMSSKPLPVHVASPTPKP